MCATQTPLPLFQCIISCSGGFAQSRCRHHVQQLLPSRNNVRRLPFCTFFNSVIGNSRRPAGKNQFSAAQPVSGISGLLFGVTRLRLWLSLLAGLFFGPFQVRPRLRRAVHLMKNFREWTQQLARSSRSPGSLPRFREAWERGGRSLAGQTPWSTDHLPPADGRPSSDSILSEKPFLFLPETPPASCWAVHTVCRSVYTLLSDAGGIGFMGTPPPGIGIHPYRAFFSRCRICCCAGRGTQPGSQHGSGQHRVCKGAPPFEKIGFCLQAHPGTSNAAHAAGAEAASAQAVESRLLLGKTGGPLQQNQRPLRRNCRLRRTPQARTDEGPTALLASLEREDSSGTFRKVYDRVKVPIEIPVGTLLARNGAFHFKGNKTALWLRVSQGPKQHSSSRST